MTSDVIEVADVRAMLRLIGDTAALDGGHAEKKRFLMEGLCKLIGADSWAWTLGCQIKPSEDQVYVGFLHGGFDEERFAALLKALEHPKMGEIAGPFYSEVADTMAHTTMERDEIDQERLAYQGDVGALWANADIGPLMLSARPLDERSLSAIAIYRRLDGAPFSEREKRIAHLILDEVSWLHLSGWPDDRGATVPKLSPRQRTILNLLIDGYARKQIALSLDISENTVSGYVKEIYRHFDVNSQAQLVHKFLSANVPPS